MVASALIPVKVHEVQSVKKDLIGQSRQATTASIIGTFPCFSSCLGTSAWSWFHRTVQSQVRLAEIARSNLTLSNEAIVSRLH